MVNRQYLEMLGRKSVIRELSEYATERAKEIGSENIYDFSLGNPSVPAPEAFRAALIRISQEMDPLALHGYSPTVGNPVVKQRIAESLNHRFGMNYGPQHIFPVSGATGAIAHAVRAVAEPGEEVIVSAPFFPEYIPYINGTGAQIRIIPASFEDFQIRFDLLEEAICEKTAAVMINSPNNPSGVVCSEETLTKLADLLTRKSAELGRNIFLISDEPYREIVFDHKSVPYPARFYDHTLTCYSFSKALSIPGERFGYVAVNPAAEHAEDLVPMFGQISRGIGHNCPSSLIQLAVSEVLEETADLSVYEINMNLLYDCFKELGFEVIRPDGTFYIMPKALPEADGNVDSGAFCRKALKHDLVFVPADGFGAPGYFRIAYCVETEVVKRAIPVIRKFVEEEYKR
ncbi:MAG: pyridoxal phosphate-dependent aminotransferase [Lachnospiraceae bacterium]|nr:pyridoxal phosphate-dependent aminotransferase [Lachnospiraceae bacterium]